MYGNWRFILSYTLIVISVFILVWLLIFSANEFFIILQLELSVRDKKVRAIAIAYLQLQLRQWGAGNVYLLVLSRWKVKVNIVVPIEVTGL